MGIVVKETGGDFEKPSMGVVRAVCSGVWDIGLQKGEWQGSPIYSYKVVIRFEIDETMRRGDFAGKRFCINGFYTKSLSSKANLCKMLESWRGRPFTKAEKGGFDLDNIIGHSCLVSIGHRENSGNAYIMSIMPLPKNMEKLIPELDSKDIPDWILDLQQKSKQNEEECAIRNQQHEETVTSDEDIPF